MIREEGKKGKLKERLMAIVAEGKNGRVFLSPTKEMEKCLVLAEPAWKPNTAINHNPRDIRTQLYGLMEYADLFNKRQQTALARCYSYNSGAFWVAPGSMYARCTTPTRF